MALPAKLKNNSVPADLSESELADLWESRTDLQQQWLLEYLDNGFNATQAAKDAGYQCSSEASFRQQGSENLNHPALRKLRNAFMKRHMGADEALSRLAEIARSDMQDFIGVDGDGKVFFDFQKAKERGKLHLLKKLKMKQTEDPETGEVETKVEFEIYDKRKALNDILDALGVGEDEDGPETLQQFNTQINQYFQGEGDTPFDDVDNQLSE